MNTFKIDNIKFNNSMEITNNFIIKSFPQNYEVSFDNLQKTFSNNEIVLVDAKIQKLYNIQHDKMIIVDATEQNKNIEVSLLGVKKLKTKI